MKTKGGQMQQMMLMHTPTMEKSFWNSIGPEKKNAGRRPAGLERNHKLTWSYLYSKSNQMSRTKMGKWKRSLMAIVEMKKVPRSKDRGYSGWSVGERGWRIQGFRGGGR